MSPDEIIEILKKFDCMLENGGILTTPLRQMGWLLIKGLVALVNVMQGFVYDILTVNGFYEYKEVDTLFTQVQPVLWGALLLIILYIGYQLMIGQIQEKSKLIQNLIMSLLVIFLLPTLMVQVGKLTNLGIEQVQSKNTTMAEEIVLNQLTDLRVVGNNGWKSTNQVNNFQSIQGINITETMDFKIIDKPYNDVIQKKLVTDEKGVFDTEVIEEGMFDVIDEKYFRWDWNFWSIVIQLAFIAATFLFTSLKAGQILFELGFHQLFASITAFLDIQNGQKLKEILKHIANTFIVLFVIALLLRLYIVFGQWVQTVDGLSEPVKVLLVVCAGLAVIDGPNLVERVLGIDAGLQSGFKTAAAMYAATKGAAQVANKVGKVGSTVANSAVSTTGFASGAIHGGVDRVKEFRANGQDQRKNQTSHSEYQKSNQKSHSEHPKSNQNSEVRSDGNQHAQGNMVAGEREGAMQSSSDNRPESLTSPDRGSVAGFPNESPQGMMREDRGLAVHSDKGQSVSSDRESSAFQQTRTSQSPSGSDRMDWPMGSQGQENTESMISSIPIPTDGAKNESSQTVSSAPTLFEATRQKIDQAPVVQCAKRSYAIGRATTQPKGDPKS